MIKDFDFINTCDISGFIKEEIRAIALYKSDASEDDIVLDINCGIGEISTEFSKLSKEVYCIDEDNTAIEFSKTNIKKHGDIDKVKFINQEPLSAIKTISDFDIAIIKANDDNIGEIIEEIHNRINSKGRIIILTNILDFALMSVNKLDELLYNPTVSQIDVSKGQQLNKGLKLISDNPMTMIYVKKR